MYIIPIIIGIFFKIMGAAKLCTQEQNIEPITNQKKKKLQLRIHLRVQTNYIVHG